MVHSIQDNGDLRISYGQNRWIVNPLAVVKASILGVCIQVEKSNEGGCRDVVMKKKGNKKMPSPRHKLIHNPIPTSLFCFKILFVCCECIRRRKKS